MHRRARDRRPVPAPFPLAGSAPATTLSRSRGINQIFIGHPVCSGRMDERTPQMTPKQAYRMGFRHITDLAEINRIADIFLEDELDDRAQRLIEAWREGAIAAAAMLEKQRSTIQ